MQHKDKRGSSLHVLRLVVDVFTDGGHAIDHRVKGFGVDATSIVHGHTLDVVEGIVICAALQDHLAGVVSHLKAVVSVISGVQGHVLCKPRYGRFTRQRSSVPTVAPRIEQQEVVTSILKAHDIGGRGVVHFSLVRGQKLVTTVGDVVQFPAHLRAPFEGRGGEGQFCEFALCRHQNGMETCQNGKQVGLFHIKMVELVPFEMGRNHQSLVPTGILLVAIK